MTVDATYAEISEDAAQDAAVRDWLLAAAQREPAELLRDLDASAAGLTRAQAAQRRKIYGPNRLARDARGGALREFARHLLTPLNGLLLGLSALSFMLGDQRAAGVITTIVLLSVLLAFVQEHRSHAAAEKLRAMVRIHASVRRPETGDVDDGFVETGIEELVPGDIIRLSAGDMIPADVRLIEAKDLFVNESTLTGESLPVEKFAHALDVPSEPLAASNLAFMGANVVSGYAWAVVVLTGGQTFFGAIAKQLAGHLARESHC
jgi:Mg2+-importing ATPase